MRSEQMRSQYAEVFPKDNLIIDRIDDKLTLSLIGYQQVLIKIFKFISEKSTHILAPKFDPLFNRFDLKYIFDER